MESQMAQPHAQSHEQEPHIVGHHTVAEGEDEHHHEKKSVLNKVKEKAKKIKGTLTKHGHGPDHEHDRIPDDHDLDEEDDEKEEIVEDPEIHGAPIYENPGQSGFNAGRSTATEVDPLPVAQNVKPAAGSHVDGREERKGRPEVNLGLTSVLGEVPNSPQNKPVSYTAPEIRHTRNDEPTRTFVPDQQEYPGQPKVNLQTPKGLEEDPASQKDDPGAYTSSKYQSKVNDPIGRGGEVGITSILGSFDKKNVHDESKQKSGQERNWPSGTEDGEEVGINPILGSFDKMNVHDESKPKSGQEENWPSGTEDFITSVPTGSHDQFSPELTPPKPLATKETFDSTKTQEYPHDNTDDRQSNQSSYTEKISSTASVIADKAITAKNVVVSKLGYGEKDNTGGHEIHGGDKTSVPASVVDSGKKIAGAGSTVTSKMPGTTTGTENQKRQDVGRQDKRVSVKDYVAEKFRPGEEDRALSEVISEAFHKKKAEQENKVTSGTVIEVIPDALHKRKEEPDDATNRPMGKETESKELSSRLGTIKHDSTTESTASSYADDSGKGVVDKIKGAVGSWLGKGKETQGSQQSLSASTGTAFEEAGSNNITTGERRLQ